MLDKIKSKFSTLFETTCGCGCRKLNRKGQIAIVAAIVIITLLLSQ